MRSKIMFKMDRSYRRNFPTNQTDKNPWALKAPSRVMRKANSPTKQKNIWNLHSLNSNPVQCFNLFFSCSGWSIDNNGKHFSVGATANEQSSLHTTNRQVTSIVVGHFSRNSRAASPAAKGKYLASWQNFCSKPGGNFRRFPPNATGNPHEIKPSLNHRIQGTGMNLPTFTNKINEMYRALASILYTFINASLIETYWSLYSRQKMMSCV